MTDKNNKYLFLCIICPLLAIGAKYILYPRGSGDSLIALTFGFWFSWIIFWSLLIVSTKAGSAYLRTQENKDTMKNRNIQGILRLNKTIIIFTAFIAFVSWCLDMMRGS